MLWDLPSWIIGMALILYIQLSYGEHLQLAVFLYWKVPEITRLKWKCYITHCRNTERSSSNTKEKILNTILTWFLVDSLKKSLNGSVEESAVPVCCVCFVKKLLARLQELESSMANCTQQYKEGGLWRMTQVPRKAFQLRKSHHIPIVPAVTGAPGKFSHCISLMVLFCHDAA